MLHRIQGLSFKSRVLLAVTAVAILLMIPGVLVLTFLLGNTNTTAEAPPPLKFEYCGASPKELCVLSFGRDGAGNALINFFVPDRKFPQFYLVIKKAGTESRYECKRNTEIKTSVFCSGEALSLKQTVEMKLFASEDDRWLASGTFFIEAFLVSTPGGTQSTRLPVSSRTASTSEASATRTPTIVVSRTTYPNPTAYP